MTTPTRLALVAGLLGGLALFAGSPYLADHGRINPDGLAADIARGEDRIDPITLAAWIRDQRQGLRVIDLRSPGDYAEFHIPTAAVQTLESTLAAPFAASDTIVIYSDGSAAASQAWVLLKARTRAAVYYLRGGVGAWLDEVMAPAIASDAPAAERDAFARASELSRYFGGAPRVIHPGDPEPLPRVSDETSRAEMLAKVARMKRRGC